MTKRIHTPPHPEEDIKPPKGYSGPIIRQGLDPTPEEIAAHDKKIGAKP